MIKLIVTLVNKNDQIFREYHYTIIKLRFANNDDNELINVCLNIDCSITINNRQTFTRHVLNLKIKKLIFSISIRDIDNIMHYIFDYIVISYYIDDYLSNNNQMFITNKFEVKIHLVDDLKTNLFIDNNVFIAQRVKINLITQSVQLNNCQNLVALINTIIKKKIDFKRTIRANQIVNVSINFIVMIFVNYHDNLSNNKDFLFESQYVQ